MKKEFRTAVDPFFIIWPILILIVQICLYFFSIPSVNTIIAAIVAVIFFVVTVLLLTIASTRYVLSEETLIIRNLFSMKHITYDRIKSYGLCECNIGLYAASTKQVELIMEHGKIRISPVKREEFTELLRQSMKAESEQVYC